MRRLVAIVALLAVTPATASAKPIRIVTLSNRADLVSAGNVLVAIRGARPSKVRVRLGRHDITRAFARRRDGTFAALITGLRDGRNTVRATAGRRRARLIVTNHPNGGPVFSGPQVQPWVCQKTATDAQCDEPPHVSYLYK